MNDRAVPAMRAIPAPAPMAMPAMAPPPRAFLEAGAGTGTVVEACSQGLKFRAHVHRHSYEVHVQRKGLWSCTQTHVACSL